ncbi:glutamate--cysteine ligase [Aeromonas bivalvium]|uniref:glutamate--cysteine ligase n=1 Tax=Aeromonas bivalvium TaxID=440079 RepID=UPI0038D136B3
MTTSSLSLRELLAALGTPERLPALKGIRRGLERETLRITPDGGLAQGDHPRSLGSALTHANITTDYSESLLEFITPATDSIESLMEQLGDIHHHVSQHIGDERLWPLSMPCFVGDEESIRLAQYGSSNMGKMKTLYRQGLKNRYGSLMQVIAGIHFNFSMPDSFWCEWQDLAGEPCCSQRFISEKYMGLIRNVYRFGWLVPYLFGASPAICSSFLKGRTSTLPFEKLGKGTLYLPYATSLRLSDLGYTSSAQSRLDISHDNLPAYVASLRRAINTHDPDFAKIGVKVNGEYRQLNDNVLQLENELYAPIRPKRTPRSGEKPSDALEQRGIEYIELRTVDVNPFTPLGIEAEQVRFFDVFLVWCLLRPSAQLTEQEIARNRRNQTKVVLEGRRPGLALEDEQGAAIGLKEYGLQLFDELALVADLLDRCCGRNRYRETLAMHREKLLDPELTYSARLLRQLQEEGLDNGCFGDALASRYREQLLAGELQYWDEAYFAGEARDSLLKQRERERGDSLSFDDFLADYFGTRQTTT